MLPPRRTREQKRFNTKQHMSPENTQRLQRHVPFELYQDNPYWDVCEMCGLPSPKGSEACEVCRSPFPAAAAGAADAAPHEH